MRLPPWLTKEEKKERFATTVAVAATVLIFVAAFLANWRENLLFLGNHIMAALELLALIVGGTVMLGHSVATHGARAAPRPTAHKPVAAKPAPSKVLPRAKTRVVVLNANGRASLRALHVE